MKQWNSGRAPADWWRHSGMFQWATRRLRYLRGLIMRFVIRNWNYLRSRKMDIFIPIFPVSTVNAQPALPVLEESWKIAQPPLKLRAETAYFFCGNEKILGEPGIFYFILRLRMRAYEGLRWKVLWIDEGHSIFGSCFVCGLSRQSAMSCFKLFAQFSSQISRNRLCSYCIFEVAARSCTPHGENLAELTKMSERIRF